MILTVTVVIMSKVILFFSKIAWNINNKKNMNRNNKYEKNETKVVKIN